MKTGVIFSFDDYSESWIHHLPLLQSLSITTTFFVSGEFLRGPSEAERRLRPLLDAGHHLGVHTFSHQRASKMWASEPEQWLANEVLCQARILSQLEGKPIRAFAYPFGDRSPATDRVLSRHFHVLRAFCKKTRYFTEPQLRTGGVIHATSIDNIRHHRDEWVNRQLDRLVQAPGSIWPVASHAFGESDWGITPARLESFTLAVHQRGLRIYDFHDFL
jgi:peptidoglycan/xylan/chitin deacetylase (PgdA/CDA1 family)